MFEIELIICIKMDLASNNQQKVDMPWNPNNQPTYDIVVSDFKLELVCYIHFPTITLRERYEPLISSVMG